MCQFAYKVIFIAFEPVVVYCTFQVVSIAAIITYHDLLPIAFIPNYC